MTAVEPLPAGHAFASDEAVMGRALALAASARGRVEPNPMVGAVVVDGDRRLIAEGHHAAYGGPHAEADALAKAGDAARGATLFVTLEPCAHHGKQPPCADAVVASGVSRVVAALGDPFAEVAGRGFERVRAAGIAVDVGLLEADARSLNAPFLKRVATGRPYVLCKWAMTLDGKTATGAGHSKWISGEESRRTVHEIRGRMDAVIAGARTAVIDDAQLTARPPGPRTPVRVILDSPSVGLSGEHSVVRTARETPTLFVHGLRADASLLSDLEAAGVETFACGGERPDIGELLDELGRRGMTNVLVEGGAGVHNAFRAAGEIDEAHVFIAPKLVGEGLAAVTGPSGGLAEIPQAAEFDRPTVRPSGDDVYVITRAAKPWR